VTGVLSLWLGFSIGIAELLYSPAGLELVLIGKAFGSVHCLPFSLGRFYA